MTTEPIQSLTDAELEAIERRADITDSVEYVCDEDTMADLRRLLAEVYRLRAENARLRKQVQDYHESADAHVAKFDLQHERLMEAEERITAVVAIHQPTAMNSWGHRTCTHCDTPGYYQEWPCPTLVALGFGEQ